VGNEEVDIIMLHLDFQCPICGFKDSKLPIEGDGRLNVIDPYFEGSVICPNCEREYAKQLRITNEGYLAMDLKRVR